MNNYERNYTLLSLCGLNCGLCPMHHMTNKENSCPGCGGKGFQRCRLVTCAQNHGGIDYCYQCSEYPCSKYEGIDAFDSFTPHRNQLDNFRKVKEYGLDAYQSELHQKIEILNYLLDNYNDGRRKTFFCTATNLLDLEDIQNVMNEIDLKIAGRESELSLKEKALIAVQLIQSMADQRNISLKLRRKR